MHEERRGHIGPYTQWSLWFLLIGIPSVFTISNTVWLGKRWKGSNSHCVCECVCADCVISSPVLQEVPWSASSGDLCQRSGKWLRFFFALPPFLLPVFFCSLTFPPHMSSPPTLPFLSVIFPMYPRLVFRPVLHFVLCSFPFLLGYIIPFLSKSTLLLSPFFFHCFQTSATCPSSHSFPSFLYLWLMPYYKEV